MDSYTWTIKVFSKTTGCYRNGSERLHRRDASFACYLLRPAGAEEDWTCSQSEGRRIPFKVPLPGGNFDPI